MLNHVKILSDKEQNPTLAALSRIRIFIKDIGGSQHLWEGQRTRLWYRARNNAPKSSIELSSEGFSGCTQQPVL